jgi:hypothetical protein
MLEEHMIEVHGVTMPSNEFIAQVERIEKPQPKLQNKVIEDLDNAPPPPTPQEIAQRATKPNSPTVEATQKATPKQAELKLEYVYTGQCPTCLNAVATLNIEAGQDLYIVAYCSYDNKQLKSLKVIPINKQDTFVSRKTNKELKETTGEVKPEKSKDLEAFKKEVGKKAPLQTTDNSVTS